MSTNRRASRSRSVVVGLVSAGLLAAVLAGCSAPQAEPPPGLTTAERSDIVQQQLDGLWMQATGSPFGNDRPHPQVVRFTSAQSVGPSFAKCMTAAGYATGYSFQYGIVGPFVGPGIGSDTASHSTDYLLAKFTCEAQYPEDPVEQGYMSAAQSRYLYNYWQHSLVPCLRSAGIDVPPVPGQPSRGSGYRIIQTTWDPYSNIRSPSSGAVPTYLNQRCPKYPAGFLAD